MRATKLAFAVLLVLTLFAAGQVRADSTSTTSYVYTADGNTFTWSLPTNPPVASTDVGQFSVADVPVTIDGIHTTGLFDFYELVEGSTVFIGGFDLTLDDGLSYLIDAVGPQLYSGPLTSPTMVTSGTFTFADYGNGDPFDPNAPYYTGTLKVSTSTAVPEPSAFLLLAVGLLAGLAVSLFRKN